MQANLDKKALPSLLSFALPILLGNIFQQLYNIVDAIVVGRFLGSVSLAGISVASPMMDIANALIIGATLGVGVYIAQLCGAEEVERLRRANATALLGGLGLTAVLAAAGIASARPILLLQGTETAVCREATEYLIIVFSGLLFCFLYNYYAAALRSCGNSRIPFFILLVSSVLHALLDILLTGVFAMGIRGVAISTVLCQLFSALLCMLYSFRRCPPLRLSRGELRFDRRLSRILLNFAWAAALQQAVICIGRFLIQGMLNSLGTDTVTGYNMGMRTEAFLFCFSQGISSAAVVFMSQSYGRGDKSRVVTYYKTAFFTEVTLAVILGAVCAIIPGSIIGIFSHDPAVIAAGVQYTGLMAFFYALSFMGEIIQSFFRGLGMLRLTMLASGGQVLLRVILSCFLIPRFGIPGISAAVITGWALLVLFEGGYSIYRAKRLMKTGLSC